MMATGQIAATGAPRSAPQGIDWKNAAAETVLNRTCALALLIVLAPLMLFIALRILREDGGPVLFGHLRVGKDGRLFECLKFRTMARDAEQRLQRLLSEDPVARSEWDRSFKLRDDPRITTFGRFLRRTSLDELPQLFNVISGEMSLVGPRPHAVNTKAAGRLFEEVVHEYAARHKVKPCITGWAQVLGWRGETDTEEKIRRRVEADLYYMEHWSLFLDIEILFRTAKVIRGENVY